MKTFDIKNFMTNIACFCIAFGTFLAGLNVVLLHLPIWVTALGGAMVGLGGAITSFLSGKNNDGSTKTQDQINAQINPK